MVMPVQHNSKRELTVFFAATFTSSWLLWLPALLIQSHILSIPVSCDFFLRAGSFGPSVSGLILAYGFGRKAELRSLFRSMINIHIRPKWLLFTFLVLPGVSAVSCLIYWLIGGRLPQPQFELWFVPVAFAYILIFMGPLGEEAGWRGFALKRMLRNASPMKSAILLGIIWSFWHLPLFFIEGTTQNALAAFGLLPAFSCYLLYTVMISVLITLLSVMSNDSVFSSMVFHAIGNLSLGVMPLIFSKSGAVILLLALSAATSCFTYKHRKIMFYKGEI
jgi:membrane protease YdiL (CAAX protease family)